MSRGFPTLAGTAIAVLVTAVAPSFAGAPSPWLSLGVLGGPRVPDARLADYQWAVRPTLAWGGEADAGFGPATFGVRVWRESDTQRLDLLDGARELPVGMTSVSAVARVRVTTLRGVDVHAVGAAGRMRMTWRPDHLEIATGGTPVTVDLAPVTTTVLEAGAGLERGFGSRWSAGMDVTRRQYPLDTAHRNGSATEYRRESFHDWSVRLQLARRLAWR